MAIQSQNAKSYLGLLMLFSFSSNGVCQTISISCPTTFTNGSDTRVKCLIDSTNSVQSGCSQSATVTFFFSKASVNSRLCQTSYSEAVSVDVFGAMNCGKVNSISGKTTFQLNFRGNRTYHEGGELTCSISCTQTLSTASSESCGPLKFDSEGSCKDGCIGGISAGSFVIIIIGTVVVAKKRRWFRSTTAVEVIG